MVVRPTPEQRAEMAAYIDEHQPGLLDELNIDRAPLCADVAKGFCAASVDGYCIGGTYEGRCFG